MLNQETKRRIDSARDILVGKVPDPKAQVEQITTAMIYKFMDDMDKEAQELGGKARFFTNGYEKYSWTIIMDPKLGGHERLNLYAEAVIKMAENPHIPQLFRDIFKDAFLPYRSPETLSLFLKEINGFKYVHSEDLGDAFEYLLSILGSQGDAGQFRTPRHIIDFIVDIVDPKKEETILDPACGTAGFLISAFKHIQKQHKDKPLSPEDKKRMMNHIVGYDISPDMVKLSKVNMYLHGFPTPHIFEYDTLSSEEKWDETYDLIMANPPFMTPKGGIRPHKRFSVQANRAEVLFVNYIMEHLNNNGRAGIIVPEGIIFQSGNAYKQLRKMLIEDNYLYAVVSLPSGVFNPYAGVKTSILLLDKQIAKISKNILFYKINSDGLDLGAQRKLVSTNDLPHALEIIKVYKDWIRTNQTLTQNDYLHEVLANVVPKEKIIKTGDWGLTGEKYREEIINIKQKWPMIKLDEVCEIKKGTSITKAKVTIGNVPVVAGGQQPAYYHNKYNREGQTITVSASGAYAGFINYFECPIFASDCTTIKSKNENNLLTKFVFRILKSKQEIIYKLQKGMGQPHVYGKELAEIKIPLPPLEVQKEIIGEIEEYQNIVDGAKQVVDNWIPRISFKNDWPQAKLVDISILIQRGKSPSYGDSQNRVIKSGQARGFFDFDFSKKYFVSKDFKLDHRQLKKGDLLINSTGVGTAGRITYFNLEGNYLADGHITIARFDLKLVNPIYVLFALASRYGFKTIESMARGNGGQIELSLETIRNLSFPLPKKDIQDDIVNQIYNIQRKLVLQNKDLIEIFEKKIEEKINEIWQT